jgi:hypothetical protein
MLDKRCLTLALVVLKFSSLVSGRESFTNLVNVTEAEAADISRTAKAGIDFPAFAFIPATNFTCRNTSGIFYSDSKTQCQVYHLCNATFIQQSFLCPNTSIFNDEIQKCDSWYKVNCSSGIRPFRIPPNTAKLVTPIESPISVTQLLLNPTTTPQTFSSTVLLATSTAALQDPVVVVEEPKTQAVPVVVNTVEVAAPVQARTADTLPLAVVTVEQTTPRILTSNALISAAVPVPLQADPEIPSFPVAVKSADARAGQNEIPVVNTKANTVPVEKALVEDKVEKVIVPVLVPTTPQVIETSEVTVVEPIVAAAPVAPLGAQIAYQAPASVQGADVPIVPLVDQTAYLPHASVQGAVLNAVVSPTRLATSYQSVSSGAGWGRALQIPTTTPQTVGWGSNSNSVSSGHASGFSGGAGGLHQQIPSQIISYSQGAVSPFMSETFFAPFQSYAPVILSRFLAPTLVMIP